MAGLKDGSLDKYYDVTEWVIFNDKKVRPVNIAVWTSKKSIAIDGKVTMNFELTSWDSISQINICNIYSGYDLTMTLIAVLQHCIDLIEVDEIREKVRKSIDFLKDNIEEIDNLIRSIKIIIPLLRNYIENLKRSAEEDIKLWEALKVERVASEEEDNTIVSPASVYLTEGSSYSSEGNVRLIEEIKENGELIRVLRIQDSYNAQEYVYIYKYNGEYYAIRVYHFDNLQGYTHSDIILYKVKNPEILNS